MDAQDGNCVASQNRGMAKEEDPFSSLIQDPGSVSGNNSVNSSSQDLMDLEPSTQPLTDDLGPNEEANSSQDESMDQNKVSLSLSEGGLLVRSREWHPLDCRILTIQIKKELALKCF